MDDSPGADQADTAGRLDMARYREGRSRPSATFPVAGRPDELCVLPEHFPGGAYSGGDSEDETELCGHDLDGPALGICPKLTSTFPGLEIYELKAGTDKQQFETSTCKAQEVAGKKVAKFKFTISCGYTGAMLGYYHFSRLLGGAGEVPAAVLRSVDQERHKAIAQRGAEFAGSLFAAEELIVQNWKTAVAMYQDDTSSAKNNRPFVFTADDQQVFGALMDNPRSEVQHPLLNRTPIDKFLGQQAVKNALNPAPVSDFVARDLDSAAAGILVMKDVGDIVLMDHVFGQRDRTGNIHSRDYFYVLTGDPADPIDRVRADKLEGTPEQVFAGKVFTTKPVPRALLKDNDCGGRSGADNVFRAAGTLAKLRHMDPVTYARFRWIAREWERGPLREFFLEEAAIAVGNRFGGVKTIDDNMRDALATLEASCAQGTLRLDLDLAAHVAGSDPVTQCGSIFDPVSGSIIVE